MRGTRMENNKIRINKYLSQCGVCSRREADRMLDAGAVTVNGYPVSKGTLVTSSDSIYVEGVPAVRKTKQKQS